MIPVNEAIKLIEQNVSKLSDESVEICKAVGRILAENIVADTDLPPFDRSQMDGFAVRADDVENAPVELKIVGESAAGRGWHHEIKKGETVRIMTGAPVPSGADTVQKVELTSEGDAPFSTWDMGKDGTVRINESVKADKNIVKRGAEIKRGERVFSVGGRINDRMIATLAAFGYASVRVGRRPRVSILTTGSEVVEIDETPGQDQIRNSNSPMLRALVESAGAQASMLTSVADDLAVIKDVIASGATEADILVITGGVSVGKYDLTKAALVELGAQIFFDRVRLKPGKPAVFAKLGETIIFGLPGNPVSAAVTFYLFVRKAILTMQGASKTDLPSGRAVAGPDVKAVKERDTYLPATLNTDEKGRLVATPTRWQGSSDFIGFAGSDALIFAAAGERYNADDVVEIFFL